MRAKRFPHLAVLVILIAISACDNVSFEGVQLEIRPATAPPGAPSPDTATEVVEESPLLPVELGPLVYLVEQTDGSAATILPVAELWEEGYRPIPDSEEIPDLIERFALGRWEEGMEFSLLGHGGRVGTFIASGWTESDNSTCRMRPRGSGIVEVSPGAAGTRQFLALPEGNARTNANSPERVRALAPRSHGTTAEIAAAALNVAQRLIPALDIPWPASIPGVREDLQAFGFNAESGIQSAIAASHVFGGRLGTGTPSPNGYSFFFLAVEDEDRYEPVVSWYQRAESGKAAARLLGTHDLRGTASPDALLEVFGVSERWLTILGPDEDGEWTTQYQDACGEDPARGAIQSYP